MMDAWEWSYQNLKQGAGTTLLVLLVSRMPGIRQGSSDNVKTAEECLRSSPSFETQARI